MRLLYAADTCASLMLFALSAKWVSQCEPMSTQSEHVPGHRRLAILTTLALTLVLSGVHSFRIAHPTAHASPARPSDDNPPLGQITGTVKDSSTGLAISGVKVDAYATTGTLIQTVFSNASGQYALSLAEGDYYVRTRTGTPYYMDQIYNGISCETGCPLAAGAVVSVTDDTITPSINFSLAPALPQVRFLYLLPTDRPFRADYFAAIQNVMYETRAWFEEQMGTASFALATARPEICNLPNPAAYYPGNTRQKVSADVLRCAPATPGTSRALWVLYADVEDACNDPGRLGVGTTGMVWLGSGDLKGLIGAPVFDSCGVQYFQPINRYIGGAAHELGHGFGLPHPPGCDAGEPTCDFGALMWSGYAAYPFTYLRSDEKSVLAGSPMFRLSNLLQNSRFAGSAAGWTLYAAPNPQDIVWRVQNGVLEFYRNPPPPGTTNQAVVLQPTNVAIPAGSGVFAQFDLGNSSTVRKRIAVLVHDQDFSDLTFCTFWLPANAPLKRYSMRTRTNRAWANATIAFYAATPGHDTGHYRVDRVSVAPDPMLGSAGTECVDPTAPAPLSVADGPDLLVNGSFGSGTNGWSFFGQLVPQTQDGALEFFRPAATPNPAGVVFQPTNTAASAGETLTSQFDLANASAIRKRVTVIVHDLDFTDLQACTFWLEPGAVPATFTIQTFAGRPWQNVTISFYDATPADDAWTRLDNVSLRKTPGALMPGTGCRGPA
jgi:hypothetical protein